MVLPRPSALRGFAPARLLRSSPRTAGRTQWQHVTRRYASGGGHGHAEASSDLPWLIGGIAVTVPSCWFLWPETSHADAHGAHAAHGDHEEEHEEAEDTKEEEAPEEDDAPAEEAKTDDAPAEEAKDDDLEDDDSEKKAHKAGEDVKSEDAKRGDVQSNTPKEGESQSKTTSDGENMPESKGKVEGVQFKGKSSAGDDDNEVPDVRHREPDSKGAFKKRIDSAYGKNLGEGTGSGSTAQPASGDPGAIDSKQKGLSSTPTRHSSQIDQDPEKSKKGEGVPETAKSQGTIDPKRPQV